MRCGTNFTTAEASLGFMALHRRHVDVTAGGEALGSLTQGQLPLETGNGVLSKQKGVSCETLLMRGVHTKHPPKQLAPGSN